MASSITKIVGTLLVLISLISHGQAVKCSSEDVVVNQYSTGKTVQNKPEWLVTIDNQCSSCAQKDLMVACDGFRTVEKVDPSVFKPPSSDGLCLVNNGQPVYYTKPVPFLYAWDEPFLLTAYSSNISCSLH